MKLFKLIIFTCIVCANAQAQSNYTHSLEGIEWVNIESKTDIVVKAYNKDKLTITADKTEIPEKAEGLKLVGVGGLDNTGIGFYVIKEGNNLTVKNLRKHDTPPVIHLPASINISIRGSGIQENIQISGFNGEIEAISEIAGSVTIKDVTGPITASTNTGRIEVGFSKVNQSSPISITTTTGEIDLSLPENTPADLLLQSTVGKIYTDFDLNLKRKDGLKEISSQTIKAAINNGGVQIQLNSAVGDIYLRKQ